MAAQHSGRFGAQPPVTPGVTHERFAGLVVTCLLGLAMLFSFGFLVGGLIRSPDLGNGGPAALMPIVLIFSGVLMPLQDLPATARNVARWIPFAYLGDALRQDLTGMPGTWSRPVDWGRHRRYYASRNGDHAPDVPVGVRLARSSRR